MNRETLIPKRVRKKWEDHCTPVFTPEMGERLKYARLKMLLDQRQLGKLLKVSPSKISDIEKGKSKIFYPPIPLSRMQAIFGKFTGYILLNSDSDRISQSHVHQTFWRTKLARVHTGKKLWKV